MTQILKKIIKFFEPRSQSGLEAFIESKRPQSTAEVEHWAKVYDQAKGNLIWMRGL